MKLNPNHKLRQIGNRFVIVDACTGHANMTNVFYMNHTAAMLWRKAENTEFTPEQLVEWLCEDYEVDAGRAKADVTCLLDSWRQFGLMLADE
ncbi:MAG: PqqD family protein [Bacteroides sp.]|nr:PqqD family protein [Roseburia sp.]MCM1346005.1 PqqD family protein [Bacteroides sp.]MCM1420836.1 PqqD family protein [Bacteroides sp.]